ncbi:MAG: M28 family peptidase [Acutalibacteraceae bacterium]|nr:M28 family peptidase [Acutalibacteraceae bacterium]
MMLETILKELTDSVSIGHIDGAREIIGRYLAFCNDIKNCGANGIMATIDNKKPKTILIDAHIDEVGMIVTNVSDTGFITVSNAGGIDLRQLPSKEVVIHGKKDVNGVFVSTPPHLSKDDEKFSNISDIKIDTGLKDLAKEIISIGDFVTYKNEFLKLQGNRISAKALDNRACCAMLVYVANKLKDKELPVNVVFLFSDSEELGLRGARTAIYPLEISEAIVTDVSFGDAPDVSASECGILGKGGMIGISPVLCREISDKLNSTAKEHNLPCQYEVMGSSTGTNADVISLSKQGVKTGLISIPLRNMHTDCEIVDLKDIENTASVIEAYVLSGGISNA